MKSLKRLFPLILIIALIAAAWASGLMDLVSFEAVKAQRGALLEAVSDHPILSVVSFIGLYTVAVALSLPIATVLTLLGGFLFGAWLGTVAIVLGATTGATILFLIARSALGDVLRQKAGILYDKIAANMDDNIVGYMLFMRLVPLFPFFLVNIVPALFNARLMPYVLTTFIGIIPGTFVYANVGRELGTIESLGDLASPETLIAFTLLGLFALIPTLYKQFKTRKKALAAIVVATTFLMSHSAVAGENYDRFLTLYDGLLQSHISLAEKDGVTYNGVNYDGWSADLRYRKALRLLLAENPRNYTGDARKAFWINTYNFLTVTLIVREDERDSIKNLGSVFTNPWKKHSWLLAGRKYTLDEIEHKILRPLGDARIHFAINCASVSCPDLKIESYRVEKLDAQLEEQVLLTLENTGKGISYRNGVRVSKIFDWFSDDFSNGDVKGWLRSYVTLDRQVSLRYLDYDWSLNKVQ